jgi:hypothetical protein
VAARSDLGPTTTPSRRSCSMAAAVIASTAAEDVGSVLTEEHPWTAGARRAPAWPVRAAGLGVTDDGSDGGTSRHPSLHSGISHRLPGIPGARRSTAPIRSPAVGLSTFFGGPRLSTRPMWPPSDRRPAAGVGGWSRGGNRLRVVGRSDEACRSSATPLWVSPTSTLARLHSRTLSGSMPTRARHSPGDRGRDPGRRQRGILGHHGRVSADVFNVALTIRSSCGSRISIDDTEPERHEVHARRQTPGDAQRGRRCGGRRSAIR